MAEEEAGAGPVLDRIRAKLSVEVVGWSLWIILTLAISVIILFQPGRSIFEIYRESALNWWAARDLYAIPGLYRFVYLPSTALLLSPFVALGQPVDDVAWRIASVALFTLGIWRLTPMAGIDHRRRTIAVILLLLIPCAGVNIQRSQADLTMAALMFLGAGSALEQRWRETAMWLALALAIKPLAIVLLLLYGAMFRPLRLPLLVGVAIVFAAPFLHPSPAYVADQYLKAAIKLTETAQPEPGHWNDLAMMLRKFGVEVPSVAMTAIRLAAALGALGVALLAVRRMAVEQAALIGLALAVCYLMLFNPRTELGSYVNLGAVMGIFVFQAWFATPRRRIEAYVLGAGILAFGTQAYGNLIYRPTDIWLKPLVGSLFLGFLVFQVLTRTRPARAD